MSAHTAPLRFCFPRVLDRLAYEHQVKRCPVIVDGRETIQWYFRWATDGVKYERIVQSPENRDAFDVFTEADFSNLMNVRGRGWSWSKVQPILNKTLRELQTIPRDASLFATKEYDRTAIELVNRFCRIDGIKLANATKLYYQKRPALIPILDDFARRVFDLPWLDGPANDFSQVLRMAFWNIREFEKTNTRSLDELQAWLNANPAVTSGLQLSRLRIIDILAWGAIKREQLD